MSSRKTTQEEQRCFWSEECPYGDYLIEVDSYLEMLIGRSTDQAEMDYVSNLQEGLFSPSEAAWILAREDFIRP